MAEMTTHQRASGILSAAKMRMLEEAGITVVSAAEWYQMQARLSQLQKVAAIAKRMYEDEQAIGRGELDYRSAKNLMGLGIALSGLEAMDGVIHEPRQEAD